MTIEKISSRRGFRVDMNQILHRRAEWGKGAARHVRNKRNSGAR